MSKTLTLTPKGLYTYYNNLASVPEGALLKANNIVINREGVAEPRRGIKWYTEEMPDYAKQLLQYKATIIRHVGSTLALDSSDNFLPNLPCCFGLFSLIYLGTLYCNTASVIPNCFNLSLFHSSELGYAF